MPALRQHRWTVPEVQGLIDRRRGYTPRYELVDGELLVTPAPNHRHQRLVAATYRLLFEYVTRHRLREALFSPLAVRLTPDSYFEPDVLVVPAVNGSRPPAVDPIRLLLAVEVLSPTSARHDRVTKRRFFQRAGLRAYWIVDGEAELFEIWHPEDDRPALADTSFTWQPHGASEALLVDVARFFADAADEPASAAE